LPRRLLLLDACVAINLAATGQFPGIAETLALTFILARQAAAEVGHLRDTIDGELVTTPIDLTQYETDQVLQFTDLEPSEYNLYIELAALVDDGEAATIAAAAHRHIQLATDDRKARNLCAQRGLTEPLRTLALMHSYVDGAGLSHDQTRELLLKIRERASFQPPRTDPDQKWWNGHFQEG
jgi:predicted nucleic acid-binding protein